MLAAAEAAAHSPVYGLTKNTGHLREGFAGVDNAAPATMMDRVSA